MLASTVIAILLIKKKIIIHIKNKCLDMMILISIVLLCASGIQGECKYIFILITTTWT